MILPISMTLVAKITGLIHSIRVTFIS
jgi:hypothetical protein